MVEIKPCVVEVGNFCGAQMAASKPWVFNHDGVWQSAFFLPLLDHQLNPPRIGQDWDQGGVGEVSCQVGQIQWQACANHQRVDTCLECVFDIKLVGAQRLHDVQGNQPLALGQLTRTRNLPV